MINLIITVAFLLFIVGVLYVADALNVLWVLIVFPVILAPEVLRGFYQLIKGRKS